MDRALAEIRRLGLTLAWTLDTHVHGDHITAAPELKLAVDSRIAAPAFDRLPCADIGVDEGLPFVIAGISIEPIHAPAHTDGHFAYLLGDRVYTGDALLIEGCGRTDFLNGDAEALYHSVTGKLFALPDETLVYPARDYQQRCVSSIVQEKNRNLRLGNGKTLEEFKAIMMNLDLTYPKFIDYAVPGNLQCGTCQSDLPGNLAQYCSQMNASRQG